jgi:hypothetical protein
MSLLEFLMRRAGAPPPRVVCILSHPEEWANRQLLEEIQSNWPEVNVALDGRGELTSCDLYVIPFDGDSPAGITQLEPSIPARWIILYGLERRRIWVLNKKQAIALVRRFRRLKWVRKILGKTKLARPLKECLRLWRWGTSI